MEYESTLESMERGGLRDSTVGNIGLDEISTTHSLDMKKGVGVSWRVQIRAPFE